MTPTTPPPAPRLAPLAVALGLWGALVPMAGRAADGPAATADQLRFFESQVRPVLVESCAGCHGAAKVKAGLRVDSRAALLAGGDSGPAVVPGDAKESPLVAAIRYEGPEMPPKGKLPAKQVEALARWVEMGAPWPEEAAPVAAQEGGAEPASNIRKPGYAVTDADRQHWAFRPVQAPPVPAVGAANPVDAFLQAGRAAKHLAANPPATKAELIRRATYDLTGLPPTPAEVDAFVASTDPDAYPQLVDRLLDSPRYGEKWGRHWLDLVRYAETNSYERDGVKPNAWRYRDYVIRSINADKPYDRFVREQLAGDEVEGAGVDGRIATGYYRLGLWDDEPADRDTARYDELDDIVATTGQVFLGLTVDCARCHDHKLDPIPQKDYYRFLAFFRNVNGYRNGGPTDEYAFFADDAAREKFAADHRELIAKRDEAQAELSAIERDFGAAYARKHAGSVAAADLDDLRYRYYRDTWDALPDFDALKPEDAGELPDGLFDLGKRTRDDAFGFVFEGTLIVPADGKYAFTLDSDDGSRLLVDGKVVATHDGIHGVGQAQEATVELKQGRVPIRLDYFQAGHGLGLQVAWSGPGFAARSLSAGTTTPDAAPGAGKGGPVDKLPRADFARLFRAEGAALVGQARAARYGKLRRELEGLKKQEPAAERALVVTESGPDPEPTHVLLRGNAHNPGDAVEPAFLQVATAQQTPTFPRLPAGSKTTGRRLALADWIASPTNPLTARVMANRIWQYHFGRGIVRSSSNFGTQGEKPTHPELLDYLAAEFVREGWRLKPMHRLIMLSEAYRMSSRANPEALAADPMNDAFWRFDMRRLTAEEVRDSILAVTGRLSSKMYGPGVYPEIPDEVKAGQSQPGKGWGEASAEDEARRSIYVHIKRSLLLPILESFDQAETDRSTPVRFATTQPTQALGMINGPFLNKQAHALAARLRREAGAEPRAQVDLAFRLATGHAPTPAEADRALGLMADLTRAGDSADEALAAFCLVVLNLDEFIYLD